MNSTCPFCGSSSPDRTPHKCPASIDHLERAVKLEEIAEDVAHHAKQVVRRFVFGRHATGIAYLEQLGVGIATLGAKARELALATPPTAPENPGEHYARRRELAKEGAALVEEARTAARTAAAAPAVELAETLSWGELESLERRARERGYEILAASARQALELLRSRGARDGAMSIADDRKKKAAEASRRAAVEAPSKPLLPEEMWEAGAEEVATRPPLKVVEPVAPAGERHPERQGKRVPPATVPDAFQFIEEDAELGNMPAPDAWAELVRRLEALGDGELLVRCGGGHSWVAKRMPAAAPVPDQCSDAQCPSPAGVLTMNAGSVATIRKIAALPEGHRLCRCDRKHEWNGDAPPFVDLRMPDGRPMCPACLQGEGGQSIRNGAEVAFVAGPHFVAGPLS